MSSSDSELKRITTELNNLSLKRQQLLERKKIQCIIQELRGRIEFGQPEEAPTQDEIDSNDEKLKELNERISELQKSHKNLLSGNDCKKEEVSSAPDQNTVTGELPGSNVFFVEAPPTIPAPTVILDLEKLPTSPCRTQCPECRQFVVTETKTSVNSMTWLVCFMSVVMGCVAGCCLIPFCLDTFKSTIHRCPKCRSSISTVKKL
ncbi:lipopolysaccharide-induced tumor necrosis factor-alpha factor [Larimichthys crocea]|uniref:lipopolysaccharide-induced tumor necrosis factor-alpha factor n=1 Tax=Larimichthys crocea TaxID=215358 RepID=UPI000F5EEC5A|nr:lipopolysaccharide-induced tumor necrosis factor-alpha factor [Larimichthys crocea]